ncbi:MAG TPA: T9SS type B sorting domain-containing protein, partial [Flavobacterium sp.]
VYNKNHQVMSNGAGLFGSWSSTQSATIVPKPGSTTLYYIFTLDYEVNANGFRYSVVDITLDGGLGAITTEKNILLYAPSDEKLSIVKHSNEEDFWVVTHGWNSNTFYSYLLSSSGVSNTAVSSNCGIVVSGSTENVWGGMKISPDGTKLAVSHALLACELMDFDNSTGVVSNAQILFDDPSSYGVEFSSDSQVLYMSIMGYAPFRIIQYDLNAANVASTAFVTSSSTITPATLQLGPDHKIYFAEYGRTKLGVINFPGILGAGCGIQWDAVDLAGRVCKFGLPPFVTSIFDATFTVQHFCFGSSTQFSINAAQNVTSALWDFGDGFTSTLLNPAHVYTMPGTYIVTLTASGSNGTTVKSKEVRIAEVPMANAIGNQSICGSNNLLFDLAQYNSQFLGSQSSSTFAVAYFQDAVGANANTNMLPLGYQLPLGNTSLIAKVYNIQNPSCYVLTTLNISLSEQPTANPLSDYVICESTPYNGTELFNLNSKNSQLLGGQSNAAFSITYHASQTEADNKTGILPSVYSNAQLAEILYARIENISNPACYATTTLNIQVIQQPATIAVSDYTACDGNNDGFESFNLSQKTNEILNGQSASTFEVKYYLNQQDMQNQVNHVIIPVTNVANQQLIYYTVSAIGTVGCTASGSFRLVVSSSPLLNTANNIFICDDNSNDGLGTFDLYSNIPSILGNQNGADFSTSYHFSFADALTGGNALNSNYQNVSNPQTIYFRLQNNQNTSCFITSSFAIGLYRMPIANPLPNITECDTGNDGTESFDLSLQTPIILGQQAQSDFNVAYFLSMSDAISGNNPLPSFVTMGNATIYAKITRNNTTCYDIEDFQLITKPSPDLQLEDSYAICEGSQIIIHAPPGLSSYTWSDGSTSSSIVVTEQGSFSLTGTKNYGNLTCSTTENFTVDSSTAPTITDVIINDWTDDQNNITIQVAGNGEYEYSLDGSHFQTSNEFHNLEAGQYTVYVNDRKGCGLITKEVYLLMYPRFFTPNGDGIHDTWQIKFSRLEPDTQLTLYDRYGKLITNYTGYDFGWDGTLNGQHLPASDYWFVVRRESGKEYRGNFSLKR